MRGQLNVVLLLKQCQLQWVQLSQHHMIRHRAKTRQRHNFLYGRTQLDLRRFVVRQAVAFALETMLIVSCTLQPNKARQEYAIHISRAKCVIKRRVSPKSHTWGGVGACQDSATGNVVALANEDGVVLTL